MLTYYFAAGTIGDGYCDTEINYPWYSFDGGDCDWSNVCDISCSRLFDSGASVESLIQDGICQEDLEIEQCCFDGGDCPCPTCQCPSCPAHLERIHCWLGDGFCDAALDLRDCCYDLGDCWCTSCQKDDNSFARQTVIANHQCNEELDNADCCFDFGDCDAAICNTCPIQHHGQLEDGLCDRHLFNEECCFDGSDCEGIRLGCPTCKDNVDLGNNFCDDQYYNVNCCFDLGDCDAIEEICPTCLVSGKPHDHSSIMRFGDFICDYFLYGTDECCYDNNDCFYPGVCPSCKLMSSVNAMPFDGQCEPQVSIHLSYCKTCDSYFLILISIIQPNAALMEATVIFKTVSTTHVYNPVSIGTIELE